MTYRSSILMTIAAMWLAAVVTPGPNFLVTTRTALLQSRSRGVQTALGVASGAVAWGLAGFFGIHALFVAVPWLYLALRFGGSLYLLILGAQMLLGSFRAKEGANLSTAAPTGAAFSVGLFTTLANPQSALSTASLFAATLPPRPPLMLGLEAVGIMTVISTTWYVLVALALSASAAGTYFMKLRPWVDRLAGLAFLGFATRLAAGR